MTAQLLANHRDVPQSLIAVMVETNRLCKDFVAYEVSRRVKAKGVPVVVYESALADAAFFGSEVTHNLGDFKSCCDLIIANRWSDELADVAGKVYTRDLFRRD